MANEKGKKQTEELVVVPVDIEVLSLEQAVNQAERNVVVFKKITGIVLKVTKEKDWVKMGDNYQIKGSASERVGGLIGVSWSHLQPLKEYSEDDLGKYYIYTFTGTFTLGRRSIEAIGTCSQRDKFFSVASGKILPTSEIDETDIKKSAYTNCIMNGVTRLLGIRGLDAEDLKNAGLNIDLIASVNFRESGQDSDSGAQKRKDIREYLLAKNKGDKKVASEELIKLTAFPGRDGNMVAGKSNIDALSPKQVDILYGKLKDAMQEFNRTNKPASTASPEEKKAPDPSAKVNPTQIKWIEDTAKKQGTDVSGFLYEYDIHKPLAEVTQEEYKSLFEAITKKG